MTDTIDQEQEEAPAQKRPNAFIRLYRGETSFDFVGRRRWWYALSGTIIAIGLISLGVRQGEHVGVLMGIRPSQRYWRFRGRDAGATF